MRRRVGTQTLRLVRGTWRCTGARNGEGEEVFSQSRSLFFKSVKVRRVYDKEANTVVYVSYSVRLSKSEDDNKSRFKSTMCTVPLG